MGPYKNLEVTQKETSAGNELMLMLTELCRRRRIKNHGILNILAQMVGIFCARLGVSPSIVSEIINETFLQESKDLNKLS